MILYPGMRRAWMPAQLYCFCSVTKFADATFLPRRTALMMIDYVTTVWIRINVVPDVDEVHEMLRIGMWVGNDDHHSVTHFFNEGKVFPFKCNSLRTYEKVWQPDGKYKGRPVKMVLRSKSYASDGKNARHVIGQEQANHRHDMLGVGFLTRETRRLRGHNGLMKYFPSITSVYELLAKLDYNDPLEKKRHGINKKVMFMPAAVAAQYGGRSIVHELWHEIFRTCSNMLTDIATVIVHRRGFAVAKRWIASLGGFGCKLSISMRGGLVAIGHAKISYTGMAMIDMWQFAYTQGTFKGAADVFGCEKVGTMVLKIHRLWARISHALIGGDPKLAAELYKTLQQDALAMEGLYATVFRAARVMPTLANLVAHAAYHVKTKALTGGPRGCLSMAGGEEDNGRIKKRIASTNQGGGETRTSKFTMDPLLEKQGKLDHIMRRVLERVIVSQHAARFVDETLKFDTKSADARLKAHRDAAAKHRDNSGWPEPLATQSKKPQRFILHGQNSKDHTAVHKQALFGSKTAGAGAGAGGVQQAGAKVDGANAGAGKAADAEAEAKAAAEKEDEVSIQPAHPVDSLDNMADGEEDEEEDPAEGLLMHDDEDSDLEDADDDAFVTPAALAAPAAPAGPAALAALAAPAAPAALPAVAPVPPTPDPDTMPSTEDYRTAFNRYGSGTHKVNPEHVESSSCGAWTARAGSESTSAWPEGMKSVRDDAGVKIAVEARNGTGKFVVDIVTGKLKAQKDPQGGQLRAMLRYQQIYKIVVFNDGTSFDIHLDTNPIFQYKKYAGQAGASGKWTNLTAGYDITAYPTAFEGTQLPVQVLTLKFTAAEHVTSLLAGMRLSGLVPVIVSNQRHDAPAQWNHARSNRRSSRSMLGRHAVSSVENTDLIDRVYAKFTAIWAWTSMGENKDRCPSEFFKMPCAQCGRDVTVFKASEENEFFPLMSLAGTSSGGKHSEHVVCVMHRPWEQDTPCQAVRDEGTQDDCEYAPQGHATLEAQRKALAEALKQHGGGGAQHV